LARERREGGQPEAPRGSKAENYFSQAYGRLHRHGLARTITTFFQNAGSGRFFHYQQPRTLTIREAARLQGFPDDFVFHGTLAEQMQLVGNAVPLPLGEAVVLSRRVTRDLGREGPFWRLRGMLLPYKRVRTVKRRAVCGRRG